MAVWDQSIIVLLTNNFYPSCFAVQKSHSFFSAQVLRYMVLHNNDVIPALGHWQRWTPANVLSLKDACGRIVYLPILHRLLINLWNEMEANLLELLLHYIL